MSIFTNVCWLCWPKTCKCPPEATEVERTKSEIFMLDLELRRENRRAREFAEALRNMARAVNAMREARMADGGLDAIPADINELHQAAISAAELLSHPRNQDRMSAMYAALSQGEPNASDPTAHG